LIEGITTAEIPVARAQVAPAGEDVVEHHDGSLAAWAASRGGTASQYVTHFNAPVSGQVGIGDTVNQTQHQGFDAGTVLRLIEDVREAADAVPAADQAHMAAYLTVIEAEVTKADPDQALLQGIGGRLKQIAGKAGDAGLTASVTALVTFLAKMLGIG
jgi:hypothetical protein